MNEQNGSALVRRPTSAVEKSAPGKIDAAGFPVQTRIIAEKFVMNPVPMKNTLLIAGELAAEMESLQEELRHASAHFHLFTALRDSVSKFQTELEKAPLFWSFTIHAHLQAAVIFICRIFDQHRSGTNFSRLLENIQNNLQLFDRENFWDPNKDIFLKLRPTPIRPSEKMLKSDIEFCDVQNPLIGTLKNWRDNAIAHKNRRIMLGQTAFLDNDPLLYESIQKLVEEGYRMLNYYSTRFHGVEFGSFPPEQLSDYQSVLSAPRQHEREK
jgi:hypothetical protein